LICSGIFLFAVVVLAGNAQAEPMAPAQPHLIEVFTSSAYLVTGRQGQQTGTGVAFHYYAIDGIHQIESNLSQDLPADPEVAKSLALKRIEHLSEDAMGHLQQSATGLAKALQYYIDRYPAIVFDGAAVVYGVADIHTAVRYYQEPKAAAINAQRAGDIVTRSGQPHVYIPLSDGFSGGQKVWPPGPLMEKNHRTGTWQMLLPRTESNCGAFGTNDLVSLNGWGGGKVDAGGDYLWNLWRPYKCCRRRGQWFLFSIDWLPYPP